MKLKNTKYKNYNIYCYEEKYVTICKAIIDKKFKINKVYKNTIRNYVSRITVNSKNYVLKSPKSENIIPQRKFFTAFKNGEAITTLKNTKNIEEIGINNFVKIYAAIVKKHIFIKESYILMESLDGEKINSLDDINKILKIVELIHKNNIYHGDLNTSNFIKINNEIKILDSQVKTEKYKNFRRWYDILNLKEDTLVLSLNYNVEENYNFLKKDLWYYVALFLKKFKNLIIIKKIKKIKKDLRKKGWKI